MVALTSNVIFKIQLEFYRLKRMFKVVRGIFTGMLLSSHRKCMYIDIFLLIYKRHLLFTFTRTSQIKRERLVLTHTL